MKKIKKNEIKIISGKFKGCKIPIKKNYNIRPTTNRMREMLFGWINKNVINANCLDCFSGSGALGIEAISRNALFVTFIEYHKNIIYELQKTFIRLKISNVKTIRVNTIKWLKKIRTPYDIIFLDPPFNTTLLQKAIIYLEKYKYIKMHSLIYIEKEKTPNQLIIPHYWKLYKEKITLKVHYQLYICQKNI
ncbi:MAG: 16S rRNA (guanine(966)-N(2))-methyltransferase RsmD [Buchnera aphidicola (Floraphis choui)]